MKFILCIGLNEDEFLLNLEKVVSVKTRKVYEMLQIEYTTSEGGYCTETFKTEQERNQRFQQIRFIVGV